MSKRELASESRISCLRKKNRGWLPDTLKGLFAGKSEPLSLPGFLPELADFLAHASHS